MIGNMVREERKKQGLTVRQLAEISGVSASHISNLENGRYEPSIIVQVKLSEALGVTLVDKTFMDYLNSPGRKLVHEAANYIKHKKLIDVDLGNPFNTEGIKRELAIQEDIEKAIEKVLREWKDK